MKTIWKFEVKDETEFALSMPRGAQILSVQTQHGSPQMWALVDPKAKKVARTFRVVGTGWDDIDFTGLTYVGTYQIDGGNFVFHLWEKVSS